MGGGVGPEQRSGGSSVFVPFIRGKREKDLMMMIRGGSSSVFLTGFGTH